MKFGSFLKLVEIQTKVASMIPFLLGTGYALYHFENFRVENAIIMFISLLAFDMATTTLNNYYDYTRALRTHGYGYEEHNAIVRDDLQKESVLAVLIILVLVAISAGIILVVQTNLIVFFIGALSFGVGILYSFGPIPISRMPLGELFSGLFMGFVIVFLAVYIHVPDQGLVQLALEKTQLLLKIDLLQIIYIFLVSLPAVVGIANIMLANNICDMEEDLANRRYTLPIYLGKTKALRLFKGLYYLAYLDMIIMVSIGLLPIWLLLVIATLIKVQKNIHLFENKQLKKETFILAVQNFVLINMFYSCILLILGI